MQNQSVNTNRLKDFFAMVASGDFVVLDTETTGIHVGEIVQIAIINSRGETLLDQLVKPVSPIPADATAIHGITNEMVGAAPTWAEMQPAVRAWLRGRNVVIYNATYDRKMMHQSDEAAGLERVDYKSEATYWCAMQLYARYFGEWNDYHQSWRWQKLTNAVRQCGLSLDVQTHTALGDCLMTLAVIQHMRVE